MTEMLRVTSGDPTAEELAALVTVLSARSASAGDGERPRHVTSEWAQPRHRMRPVIRRRPDGWRLSGRPH